jgi:hypothetical protein
MTNSTTYEPYSHAEKLEEEAADAGLAVGYTLRAGEIAMVVLIGLLVCPPLAILAVLVVVPLLAIGLVLGLIAAVLSVPYLLVHRLRGHRGHGALLAHRLRQAGGSLADLLPHRLVAGVHRASPRA